MSTDQYKQYLEVQEVFESRLRNHRKDNRIVFEKEANIVLLNGCILFKEIGSYIPDTWYVVRTFPGATVPYLVLCPNKNLSFFCTSYSNDEDGELHFKYEL